MTTACSFAPRTGDWFQTYTGRQFWPFDPRPEDIDIRDIAHALSRICRFGGHLTDWYCVAQHCLVVSELLPARLALRGLMHDAEEAYTGDMVRPIKHGLRKHTNAFDVMASGITDAIRAAFHLPLMTPEDEILVHRADNIALSTERRDLLLPTGRVWRTDSTFPPAQTRIVPMSRDDAEHAFLRRFHDLTRAA